MLAICSRSVSRNKDAVKILRKKFKSYDPNFDQIRTRYGSGYSWRE